MDYLMEGWTIKIEGCIAKWIGKVLDYDHGLLDGRVDYLDTGAATGFQPGGARFLGT